MSRTCIVFHFFPVFLGEYVRFLHVTGSFSDNSVRTRYRVKEVPELINDQTSHCYYNSKFSNFQIYLPIGQCPSGLEGGVGWTHGWVA